MTLSGPFASKRAAFFVKAHQIDQDRKVDFATLSFERLFTSRTGDVTYSVLKAITFTLDLAAWMKAITNDNVS